VRRVEKENKDQNKCARRKVTPIRKGVAESPNLALHFSLVQDL
jgi:hypothetical protein